MGISNLNLYYMFIQTRFIPLRFFES